MRLIVIVIFFLTIFKVLVQAICVLVNFLALDNRKIREFLVFRLFEQILPFILIYELFSNLTMLFLKIKTRLELF
jgi:hypothetical protein